MRELKFRAWNDEKYIYAPNRFVYTDDYDKNDVDCYEDIGEFFATRDNIEQYTGLKDKNGKEIYEGDIVKIEAYGRVYQVVYRKWDCSFVYENDEDEEIIRVYDGFPRDYEVIGNIHENPELLRGEE